MKYLAILAACAFLMLAVAAPIHANGGYGRSAQPIIQTNVYAAPPVQQGFSTPTCGAYGCGQAQQFQQPFQAPLYQSGGCGQGQFSAPASQYLPPQQFQGQAYQQGFNTPASVFVRRVRVAAPPVYVQPAQFGGPVYGGGAAVIVQQRGLLGRRSTVIVR